MGGENLLLPEMVYVCLNGQYNRRVLPDNTIIIDFIRFKDIQISV